MRIPTPQQAIAVWRRLLEAGVYVNLAVPPGTPNGISLLRCSVSAAHTEDQVRTIRDAFASVARTTDLTAPSGDSRKERVAQAGG